ncbi:ATP-binding protein [Dokdonia sp. LLG6352-1]|uniref:tetratricopeptide repeat-containing sensor histidine kinase n=1 Tax=Dokdonia sp. LLG6352-1 TaxID=3160831 RepID=UPI0038658D44
MKKYDLSFPIFFLTLFYLLIFTSHAHSQTKEVDSTTFYYNSIMGATCKEAIQKGVVFFENELKTNIKKEDPHYRAQILDLISLGYFNMDEFFKSEISAIDSYKSLDLASQTIGREDIKIRLGNRLGRLYRRLGDDDNALKYYKNTLPLLSKKRDSLILSNNIASIHMDRDDYQKAVDLLAPFVIDSTSILEKKYLATILDNYGYSLSHLRSYEGLSFMKRAEDINKTIGYVRGLFSVKRHLSQYYGNNDKFLKASKYAQEANVIANSLGSLTYKKESLGLLIEAGITTDALAYKQLSDSLQSVQEQVANKYVAQKYDYSVFQNEAQESELVAQKEKTKNRFYQFLVIFLILLAVAVFIISRLLNKKKRMEEMFKTEARFSKKIHDEVSNDIYKVMAHMQSSKELDPGLMDNLESIYNRTRDISRETSPIDASKNFQTTLSDLLLGYQSDSLNIVTRNSDSVRWAQISNEKKNAIYRVLQELITNTVKHGRASLVLIEFNQDHKKIAIRYKDNGIGSELSNKNGLQNVENRIKAFKGTVTFESEKNKGFQANIQM